jgi:hypothetical protein
VIETPFGSGPDFVSGIVSSIVSSLVSRLVFTQYEPLEKDPKLAGTALQTVQDDRETILLIRAGP